jgi:uncharacterized protein involved in tolerance to divalent cations
MNKLNKSGAGKVFSVYWFAMILIIAGGVFAMVYLFYGTPFDVRELEAHVLTNKIADCVSYSGKINSNLISNGIISENKELFMENCHLTFSSIEWEEEQYYAEVDFYKLENLDNPFFSMTAGNSNWLSDCEIQENKEYKKLAKCNEGNFYSVDDANNQYIIKILTAVRKSEKNVKI